MRTHKRVLMCRKTLEFFETINQINVNNMMSLLGKEDL
jgi:hypothetical protein